MTTDRSDIVERLHSNANSWCQGDAFDGRDNEEEARINDEAADEITRLRAALAAETERCARVAEEWAEKLLKRYEDESADAVRKVAATIRARG